MPVASTSKDQFRGRFREYRRSLSADRIAAWSALLASRVMALDPIAEASMVHTYWPQPDEGEIDTRPLVGALRSQDISVVLPVVTSYEPGAPAMEHRLFDRPSTMRPNRWGIQEPVDTDLVDPEDLDVVVVPALGAGRNGHRIGRGAGYYDAFLRDLDCPKIGLVYEECLVSSVPADPHDVPLTHIVTEKRSLRVSESPP